MGQRGENLGLALEPRHAFRVGGKRVGQDLERDLALESAVAGAIHLAHAALPEQAEHVNAPSCAPGPMLICRQRSPTATR